VNSSLAPKLLLAGLLILTLSLKVLAIGTKSGSAQRAEMVRNEIASFLAGHGFRSIPEASVGVSARSGGCELSVAEAAHQGWHQDALRRSAAQEDQVSFFFRGRMYPGQPVWQTRLSGYWAAFLQNLGLNAQAYPVIGIVSSPACKLDAMPWAELAGKIAAVH
jgi:hypothetical protein